MATVNDRATVDRLIMADGFDPKYPEDPRCIKIVQYNNQFNGGIAYGLVFEGMYYNAYEESLACHNVEVLWEAKSV
jgi:hypothetical protein